MATFLRMKNLTIGSCPSQIITPSSLWTRLPQTNAKQIPKFPDFFCSDRFGFLARRGNFSASTGAGPAPCAKVALQNRGPLTWTMNSTRMATKENKAFHGRPSKNTGCRHIGSGCQRGLHRVPENHQFPSAKWTSN